MSDPNDKDLLKAKSKLHEITKPDNQRPIMGERRDAAHDAAEHVMATSPVRVKVPKRPKKGERLTEEDAIKVAMGQPPVDKVTEAKAMAEQFAEHVRNQNLSALPEEENDEQADPWDSDFDALPEPEDDDSEELPPGLSLTEDGQIQVGEPLSEETVRQAVEEIFGGDEALTEEFKTKATKMFEAIVDARVAIITQELFVENRELLDENAELKFRTTFDDYAWGLTKEQKERLRSHIIDNGWQYDTPEKWDSLKRTVLGRNKMVQVYDLGGGVFSEGKRHRVDSDPLTAEGVAPRYIDPDVQAALTAAKLLR